MKKLILITLLTIVSMFFIQDKAQAQTSIAFKLSLNAVDWNSGIYLDLDGDGIIDTYYDSYSGIYYEVYSPKYVNNYWLYNRYNDYNDYWYYPYYYGYYNYHRYWYYPIYKHNKYKKHDKYVKSVKHDRYNKYDKYDKYRSNDKTKRIPTLERPSRADRSNAIQRPATQRGAPVIRSGSSTRGSSRPVGRSNSPSGSSRRTR